MSIFIMDFKAIVMKTCLVIVFLLLSSLGFSQNNLIVKTEDGRRVLLKADFTWEYIDLQPLILVDSGKVKNIKPLKANSCTVTEDFEEPKLNQKTQNQLKKGRATIKHIKQKVAKDFKCSVEEVVLIKVSETKASGVYVFCANGTKVTYKRMGHSVSKKIEIF